MFEIFKLNLDTDDFTKKLGEANKLIGAIGAGDSIKGLVENLKLGGTAAAALAVAYGAVKAAINWTEEAEEIKAVQNEFKLLGEQAGIATDKLKNGLEQAAGGLIDDTDLLKAANKAIVEMGSSAAKLPEIMEVARKASALTGENLLTSFESLNQSIASGNQRGLKNLGIIIDLEKAQRKYAESIGTTVSALSQEEKQQATMLAVIEKGKTSFQGIDLNAREASNTLQKIAVNFKSIYESIALIIEKAIGPLVRAELTGFNTILEATAKGMKRAFGQESGEEKVSRLSEKLHEAQYELDQWNTAIEKVWFGKPSDAVQKKAQDASDVVAKLRTELHAAMEEAGTLKGPGGVKSPAQDTEGRLKEEATFQKELFALKQQTLDEELKNADTVEEVNRIHEEKRVELYQGAADKIIAIRANTSITESQQDAEIEQVNQQLTEKLKGFDDDLREQRLRSIDTWEKKQVAAGNAMTGAMAADSKRAAANFSDLGKTGHTVFNAIGNNAKAAFKAMGDGSKDASQAMRGFIMGAIADTAEAKGEEMLLAGIWPPNPAAIAGGGALIALAQVLRSQSQGSQGVGGGTSPGGGGVPGASPSPALDTSTPTDQKPQERKSVVVAFNGPVINTEQTRQFIAETVRDAGDFTDFKITELGIG